MRFFLEDSVEVSRPFEAVREHFVSDGTWFVPLASGTKRTAKRFTSVSDRRGRAGEWRVKSA
jgi:hypothetical protein